MSSRQSSTLLTSASRTVLYNAGHPGAGGSGIWMSRPSVTLVVPTPSSDIPHQFVAVL